MGHWSAFFCLGVAFVATGCGRLGFDSTPGDEIDAGRTPGPPPVFSLGILVGSPNDQRSHAVAGASNGDVVLAVHGSGDTNFGDQQHTATGDDDIYILRLTPDGAVLWSRQFGGSGRDVAFDLAVDENDNIYAVGLASGAIDFGSGIAGDNGSANAFVLSLDGNGTPRWSHVIGDATDGDMAFGVTVSEAGNIVVTGWLNGNVDVLGNNVVTEGQDAYLATFSTDGQLLRLRQFEGEGLGQGQKADTDASGNIYLSGVFTGESLIGAPTISAGGRDLFALAVDAEGELLWSHHTGGSESDDGTRIASDGGRTYVGGLFRSDTLLFGDETLTNQGGDDGYLAAFDQSGEPLWALQIGGPGEDDVHGLLVAPDSTVVVAGRFSDSIELGDFELSAANGIDIFVAGLSREGEVLWAQRYGGTANESILDFERGADGSFLAVGSVGVATNLGGGEVVADGTDPFLLRLAPAP